jgi:hypothetical protein
MLNVPLEVPKVFEEANREPVLTPPPPALIVMVLELCESVTFAPPANTTVPEENVVNVPEVFPDALTIFAKASTVILDPFDERVTMLP